LSRYPDLYPDHVVGIVRAGEVAGFLPEALDEVARQAQSAHAFHRWFFWVWFLMVNFLLSVPGTWIAMEGMIRAWDNLDKSGGRGANGGTMQPPEAVGSFMSALWHETLWPWGPLTLLFFAGIYFFRRYYISRYATKYRHELGLRFPVYGKRARHENLARFAWTMSRVARAGIAPARAWQLAADSVPNQAFRDELLGVGKNLGGSERMSDLVFKSKIFPEEYAPIVATGEYTGNLPGALERLSQVSEGEYQAAENYAKVRSGCWGALGCFVSSGICAIIFAWFYYHVLMGKVLGDSQP
jgi:type II secretory pathway component PulF